MPTYRKILTRIVINLEQQKFPYHSYRKNNYLTNFFGEGIPISGNFLFLKF